MLNINNKIKGFSILEVVISISIITVAMSGISSMIIQNIQVQDLNRDNFIASMLAQEGLELLRNVRDDNWLDLRDWKYGDGIGSVNDLVQDGKYIINKEGVINDNATDIDSIDDNRARLYLFNGLYEHNSAGTSTPFYRIISVINNDDDFITASSTVKWRSRNKTNTYSVEARLYNWK